MRYITESELRDSFALGVPERYALPSGARLTPAARQYLLDLKLFDAEQYETSQSEPVRSGLQLQSGLQPPSEPHPQNEPYARSTQNDSRTTSTESTTASVALKPEHMTHLTRTRLVCKAHPRIELRGMLDSLSAELLLAQIEAPAGFVAPLEDATSLVHRALAADVKEEPLGDWRLDGMSPEEIHRASHHPEDFGFAGHIRLTAADGRFPALLDRLRTQARACELCAVRAYWQGDRLEREDIVLALNRLSSYFYVLELRAAKP